MEFEAADADAEEAEGGMADGGGHAADLAVLAFEQFQGDPAGGHGLAEADGRVARGNLRLRIEDPGAAGQGLAALKDESLAELEQGVRRGDAFDLDPVFALVGVARVEQSFDSSAASSLSRSRPSESASRRPMG